MKVYAYERVSTRKQDAENQRYQIEAYCAARGLVVDEWVSETVSGTRDCADRRLGELLPRLQPGDLLVTCEISRLSRTLFGIFEVLKGLTERDVRFVAVKNNFELAGDIQSKVLAFAFGLAAEIERDLISQRTKQALDRKRAEGVRLGRRPGSRNKHPLLQDKEPAIRILLQEGCNYSQIARLLHCDRSTLMRYIDNYCPELRPQGSTRAMPSLSASAREMVRQTAAASVPLSDAAAG